MGIANDVDLITAEIPVEYDTVRTAVPDLWNKYKPKVHMEILIESFRSILLNFLTDFYLKSNKRTENQIQT